MLRHTTTYCVRQRGCRRPVCLARVRAHRNEVARALRARRGQVHGYLGLGEESVAALLVDILETFVGSWFTVDSLVAEAQRRRSVTRNTVERAVWRLIKSGLVEKRGAKRASGADLVEIRRAVRGYL